MYLISDWNCRADKVSKNISKSPRATETDATPKEVIIIN